jgi:hypothetical protein
MNCRETREHLNDHLDGLLAEEVGRAVEQHLGSCLVCRREWQALRELVDEARRLPPSVEPATDLWPGIAARLEQRRVVPGRFGQPRHHRVLPRLQVAAAALLLVVLTAFVTTLMVKRHEPRASLPAAPTADVVLVSLDGVEADLESTRRLLLEALDARRDTLSPRTMAEIEMNLRTIDRAIAQIHEALESDPANLELRRMLAAAYQKECRLLHRATKLPAGT